MEGLFVSECVEFMKRMKDNYIDLTLTSPPYDNIREYKGYKFDFEKVAESLFRITKPGGVVVWVVSDQTIKGNETGNSFRQALFFKDIGFNLFDTMIYLKQPRGAVGSTKTYWHAFDYMFVLSKGMPKTINLINDRENKESRDDDVSRRRQKDGSLKTEIRGGYSEHGRRLNVWEYATGKGHSSSDSIAFNHPAIFPEKLAEDHIISWSNENDIVFDPMCGSGTTCKMAKKNNRRFIGVDISHDYIDIARQRTSQMDEQIYLAV